MNRTVLAFLIAPIAIGVIVLIIVVGVVPMNDSAAAFAGRVVIVVAGVAERRAVRACVVVRPDSVAAVRALDGFGVVAVIAEYAAVKFVVVIGFDYCSAAAANGACGFVRCHGGFSLIFFCQKHSGVGFVVYDEDFCCDGVIAWKCENALVGRFFLGVSYLLIAAVCNEFENLQIVFALDFHAVDTVPENYLRHERHGACYALCDITLVVEHTFLLSRTQKIPEAFTLRGNFCVPKIILIAYAAT